MRPVWRPFQAAWLCTNGWVVRDLLHRAAYSVPAGLVASRDALRGLRDPSVVERVKRTAMATARLSTGSGAGPSRTTTSVWWRRLVPAFPIGLAAGFGGACAGAGGAVFMIPALVRYVKLPQRVAQGTALLASCGTAFSSAVHYALAGYVDASAAFQLMVCSAALAPVGVAIGQRLNAGVLRRALGVLLVLLAPLLPLRDRLLGSSGPSASSTTAATPATGTHPETGSRAKPTASAAPAEPIGGAWSRVDDETRSLLAVMTASMDWALLSTGSAVGFLSGLLGVSGGTLFTPALALFYASQERDAKAAAAVAGTESLSGQGRSAPAPAKRHGLHTIIGTAMFAMLFPAAVAGFGYARRGQVSFAHLPGVILGTLTGASLGSQFALLVDESVLRFGFAVVFMTLGIRLMRAPVVIESPIAR
ncbi:hypothetical protein CCYA_CCYA15G3979 [Cyanidiococcus yangmingshanensis]|nr:hypothetical protein CCYA_CCYA15G3979 [Cyanidiococcus yangmingshanensis]